MNKRYKALIFPGIILCAMSAYSALSLFTNIKFSNDVKTRILSSSANEVVKKNQRNIASSIDKPQALLIDCEKQFTNLTVSSPQIFIKLMHCQIDLPMSDYKLVNTTNQYMAQFFQPTKNVVVTDFIQLAQGENILKFEISLNDKQKKTQIIKIDRISTEIQ